MPLYDYKCSKCENSWVEIKQVSARREPVDSPCPKCKGVGSIDMVIAAPALVDQVNYKRPQWFQDKLREMKKDRAGTTVDHLIG